MKTVTLAVVVVLFAIAPAASRLAEDRLIVPGERIGRWSLDMGVADLLAALGPPTRVYPEDLKQGHAAWHWKSRGILVVTSGFGIFRRRFRDGRRVEALEVELPEFKTEKGISTMSRCSTVGRVYGWEAEGSRPNAREGRVIYHRLGIAFRFSTGPPGIYLPLPPPHRYRHRLRAMTAIGIFRPLDAPARGIWRTGRFDDFECPQSGTLRRKAEM